MCARGVHMSCHINAVLRLRTHAYAPTHRPAVEHARVLVEDGAIGEVVLTCSDFCINGSDVGPYPTDTIFDRDAGGGKHHHT